MVDRVPIQRASGLKELDLNEMTEGYRDGFSGFPCGDNRSYSYWHGWRNGMVDGGHTKLDDAQRALVHDVAPGGKMND